MLTRNLALSVAVLFVCSLHLERSPYPPPCFTEEARANAEANPDWHMCRLPQDLMDPSSGYTLGYRLTVGSRAYAGETFIGRILVSDAGSSNNAITGYGTAGCSRQTDPNGAGACDQAFPIGVSTKLTLQAVDELYVSVNRGTTDAGIGMHLTAGEKFPTSTSSLAVQINLPDGGSYNQAAVSISPAVGATSARLNVSTRSGTE